MASTPHSEHAEVAAHAHANALEGDDVPHHGPVLTEPKSPAWLPLLGVALLALVLVWWLSTPNADEERAAAAAASASASASAEASAAPSAVIAQPAQPQAKPTGTVMVPNGPAGKAGTIPR